MGKITEKTLERWLFKNLDKYIDNIDSKRMQCPMLKPIVEDLTHCYDMRMLFEKCKLPNIGKCRVDILAKSIDGTIHLIEVKKNRERNGQWSQDAKALVQLLRYFMEIAKMNLDPEKIRLYYASDKPGDVIQEMADFYGIPIKIIDLGFLIKP
jgi:hypothetical protein